MHGDHRAAPPKSATCSRRCSRAQADVALEGPSSDPEPFFSASLDVGLDLNQKATWAYSLLQTCALTCHRTDPRYASADREKCGRTLITVTAYPEARRHRAPPLKFAAAHRSQWQLITRGSLRDLFPLAVSDAFRSDPAEKSKA